MKVTLTEAQVKKLMSDYKLLNEVEQGFNPTTVTKSIDLGATFDSGKYILDSKIQSTINERLAPLVQFLQTNPSSDVKITIVAGESRVTNYDREKCGPKVFTPECKLKPKQLSLLRAQQIETYLGKIFNGLKSEGRIQKLPPKPLISTVLGSTPYVAGKDNPDDAKYKQEQKIELLIDASASYECLVGMKITISYETPGDHTCDEAIFDVQLNNVSLGVANLNNGSIDMRGAELMAKISQNTIKRKIITYNDKVVGRTGRIVWGKETIVNDELQKKMGTLYEFLPEDMGKSIMDITIKSQIMQKKIRDIKGRETDKKIGGVRRQNFVLDQTKAKTIVDRGRIKDRLILSITPLVSKDGPYKEFFKKGSHSDVPTVKISNGEGEVLYSGNPNVKMTRGSTSKTILLQTDLCGKPLKG